MVIHDRYLAPSLHAPFAEDLARRLSRLSMGPVLEIAAGTGTLTQALAASMSVGLSIVSTDADRDCLAYAAAKPGMARVTWQRADPRDLPYPNGTFGVVTSHFGIQSMPNRRRVFYEVRRVMKQTGRFTFTVPGNISHNPVSDCVQGALESLFPVDPPRLLTDFMHGYADHEIIDDDLSAAGFTDAVYTTLDLTFAAATARDVAAAYCLGTTLRDEIRQRTGDDTQPAVAAVTQSLQNAFGRGRVETTMRAHFVSASG